MAVSFIKYPEVIRKLKGGRTMPSMKILLFGATGMLGSRLFYYLDQCGYDIHATTRHRETHGLPSSLSSKVRTDVRADDIPAIERLIAEIQPDVIINCIGIIKQVPEAKDPIQAIRINALFPHQLAQICTHRHIKLIHISTDCVFDGIKGNYRESDLPSPTDLYGRTKLLGELNQEGCLTLRTSIIGHELHSRFGLVEWFLGQTGPVKGYTRAIYTGLPTVEFSRIIAEYILPRPELNGLYHISADPITKYDLLQLIKTAYQRDTVIIPDDSVVIDRSLNSEVFRKITGYQPLSWPNLVEAMYQDYCTSPLYSP